MRLLISCLDLKCVVTRTRLSLVGVLIWTYLCVIWVLTRSWEFTNSDLFRFCECFLIWWVLWLGLVSVSALTRAGLGLVGIFHQTCLGSHGCSDSLFSVLWLIWLSSRHHFDLDSDTNLTIFGQLSYFLPFLLLVLTWSSPVLGLGLDSKTTWTWTCLWLSLSGLHYSPVCWFYCTFLQLS